MGGETRERIDLAFMKTFPPENLYLITGLFYYRFKYTANLNL